MADDAKKTTSTKSTTKTEEKSQKVASAELHSLHPGIREAMVGPTSADLNPAYAPLTADDE